MNDTDNWNPWPEDDQNATVTASVGRDLTMIAIALCFIIMFVGAFGPIH